MKDISSAAKDFETLSSESEQSNPLTELNTPLTRQFLEFSLKNAVGDREEAINLFPELNPEST